MCIRDRYNIILPPQLESICVDTPCKYKHITIDLSHCTKLIGIDLMSKYLRVTNIPTSVRWIYENNCLTDRQFYGLLKHINILHVQHTITKNMLLDHQNIKVVICDNNEFFDDCGIIIKVSRITSILIRDIIPEYILKNIQELEDFCSIDAKN